MSQEGIIIFNSTHRVMKAEKVLKENGIDFDIIPTPRGLRSDCGLAIKFPFNNKDEIEKILKNKRIKIAELHII